MEEKKTNNSLKENVALKSHSVEMAVEKGTKPELHSRQESSRKVVPAEAHQAS